MAGFINTGNAERFIELRLGYCEYLVIPSIMFTTFARSVSYSLVHPLVQLWKRLWSINPLQTIVRNIFQIPAVITMIMYNFMNKNCVIYISYAAFYVAYAVSLEHFYHLYTMPTKSGEVSRIIILIFALTNASFAFIGMFLYNFKLTHPVIALLYIYPLVIFNTVWSLVAIYTIRRASWEFPTAAFIVGQANNSDYIQWYNIVQSKGKCCGFWGWWDYPGVLGNAADIAAGKLNNIIPESCCTFDYPDCKSLLDLPLNGTLAMTGKRIIDLYDSSCEISSHAEQYLLKTYKQSQNLYLPDPDLNSMIYTCGCYAILASTHMQLYDFIHHFFLIASVILVILMIAPYVKLYKRRRLIQEEIDRRRLVHQIFRSQNRYRRLKLKQLARSRSISWPGRRNNNSNRQPELEPEQQLYEVFPFEEDLLTNLPDHNNNDQIDIPSDPHDAHDILQPIEDVISTPELFTIIEVADNVTQTALTFPCKFKLGPNYGYNPNYPTIPGFRLNPPNFNSIDEGLLWIYARAHLFPNKIIDPVLYYQPLPPLSKFERLRDFLRRKFNF